MHRRGHGHQLSRARYVQLLCQLSSAARGHSIRLAFALLVLFAISAQAAQITMSVTRPAEPRMGMLYARRVDGMAGSVEQPVAVPGTADVSLPGGLYEIGVVADGLWAA